MIKMRLKIISWGVSGSTFPIEGKQELANKGRPKIFWACFGFFQKRILDEPSADTSFRKLCLHSLIVCTYIFYGPLQAHIVLSSQAFHRDHLSSNNS